MGYTPNQPQISILAHEHKVYGGLLGPHKQHISVLKTINFGKKVNFVKVFVFRFRYQYWKTESVRKTGIILLSEKLYFVCSLFSKAIYIYSIGRKSFDFSLNYLCIGSTLQLEQIFVVCCNWIRVNEHHAVHYNDFSTHHVISKPIVSKYYMQFSLLSQQK